HVVGAELGHRAPGHLIQHARKLQHRQRVTIHLPASSSRAIALMTLPSALPLNCGTTLPITAPRLLAPAAIAARTADRISSEPACAGWKRSSFVISALSFAASSL